MRQGTAAPEQQGGSWTDYIPRQTFVTPQDLYETAKTLGSSAVDFAKQQAGITGTHYRNLAHFGGAMGLPSIADASAAIGLPIDPPTPEAQQKYQDEVITGAATVAGGAAGAGISRGAQALGRGLMRGGSKSAAERYLADQARHVVPPGSPATAGLTREFVRPAAVGVGTEMAVDWSDPATSEFWDSLISIPSGIAAGGAVSREARANLLLQHPKFREVAMRASRAGLSSKAIGALVGYALAQLYPEESP